MTEGVSQKLVGCLMAVAAATPGVLSLSDSSHWGVFVVRAAYGLPLLWWNRPAAMFWLTTILILVSEVTLGTLGQPSGEWAFIPLVVSAFVIGLRGNRERQLVGVVGFVGVVTLAVVINLLTATPDNRVGLSPIVTVGLIGVSWLIGRETQAVRLQAEVAENSLHLTMFEAEAREQRAVAAERLRIAHDVHDLASHSLSALVVRTEMVQLRMAAGDNELATEIRSIGDDGRRAMEDFRKMLTVTHVDRICDGRQNGVPLPGRRSESLSQLLQGEVAASRRSNPVILIPSENLPEVPSDIAEVIARFVREALMNADQYAPTALVEVLLRLETVRYSCQ